MLIEFKVSNFRSIRTPQTFSMVAGAFPQHLQTNTSKANLPGEDRVLRSSVIYGANAAGKTNILLAINFMKNFVMNSASAPLNTPPAYEPFKLAKETREAPSEFQITFVENKVRYEYGFSVDSTRITKEWLVEYVFSRGRTLFDRAYDKKSNKYKWKLSPHLKGQRSVWTASTRPQVLFLSNAIASNNTQLLSAFEWFQKRLVVIVGVTFLNPTFTLKLLDTPEGKEQVLPFIREADFSISDASKRSEPIPAGAILLGNQIIEQKVGRPTPDAIRINFSHMSEDKKKIEFDLNEESSGTQVLFRSAGAWLNVMANGEVLLFDEVNTSLHAKLTRFLIEQFHSNRQNKNNAQLIFTTHDTSLLDLNIFRRDQIWFVEKGKDVSTKLYPLTDFRPRSEESLQRNYMYGKYGAIPILSELKK